MTGSGEAFVGINAAKLRNAVAIADDIHALLDAG